MLESQSRRVFNFTWRDWNHCFFIPLKSARCLYSAHGKTVGRGISKFRYEEWLPQKSIWGKFNLSLFGSAVEVLCTQRLIFENFVAHEKEPRWRKIVPLFIQRACVREKEGRLIFFFFFGEARKAVWFLIYIGVHSFKRAFWFRSYNRGRWKIHTPQLITES